MNPLFLFVIVFVSGTKLNNSKLHGVIQKDLKTFRTQRSFRLFSLLLGFVQVLLTICNS